MRNREWSAPVFLTAGSVKLWWGSQVCQPGEATFIITGTCTWERVNLFEKKSFTFWFLVSLFFNWKVPYNTLKSLFKGFFTIFRGGKTRSKRSWDFNCNIHLKILCTGDKRRGDLHMCRRNELSVLVGKHVHSFSIHTILVILHPSVKF